MRKYSIKIGAGRERDYYGIKKWLDSNGIKVGDVAKAVGLHCSVAGHTIYGRMNNRKILWHLVDLGCPHELLSLPQDMIAAVNAKN